MKKRSKLLIGAVIALLAVAVIPLASFAQQGPDSRKHADPVHKLMQAMIDTASQTLGMTSEAFVQALHQGQTPAQLADEAGVAREDLKAALQASWNAQGEEIIGKFIENGLPDKPNDRRRFNAVRQWTKISAESLQMSEQDFVQALRSGQTPAQIAEAQGSSGQALVDAIVAAEQERLSQAVADGKLTQEQADKILADLPEKAGQWVENGMPDKPNNRRRFNAVRQWTKISAESLQMSEQDFVQALRSGQTPAQIAEAQGSSGQALVDAIVAAEQERLNQAVADGKLTQEQADKILADLPEKAGQWVENGMPQRPHKHR